MRAAMASNLAANAIVRKNFSQQQAEDRASDIYSSKRAIKAMVDDPEIEDSE